MTNKEINFDETVYRRHDTKYVNSYQYFTGIVEDEKWNLKEHRSYAVHMPGRWINPLDANNIANSQQFRDYLIDLRTKQHGKNPDIIVNYILYCEDEVRDVYVNYDKDGLVKIRVQDVIFESDEEQSERFRNMLASHNVVAG